MPSTAQSNTILRVSSLKQTSVTRFKIEPDAPARAELAQDLGLDQLRKLRFEGELSPKGKRGWQIDAKLGATVVQACIVTLDPVTTRIDESVTRKLLPEAQYFESQGDEEIEMPEDDETDILGEEIDLNAIMAEALALLIPAYPRKDGAQMDVARFAEDGVAPMTDEDAKPFAGLAALKEKLQNNGNEG